MDIKELSEDINQSCHKSDKDRFIQEAGIRIFVAIISSYTNAGTDGFFMNATNNVKRSARIAAMASRELAASLDIK